MKKKKTKVAMKKKDTYNDASHFPNDIAYKVGTHVIAGRPASGNTSFSIDCITDCIRSEYPIAYVSLDMTKKHFLERFGKKISPSEINNSIKRNLFFYLNENEVTKLLPCLQSLRNNGVKVAIIDFVQLLKVNGNPLETDHIIAILSAFALKHQMSIVLLCQLTRFSKDVYPFAQTIQLLGKETNK